MKIVLRCTVVGKVFRLRLIRTSNQRLPEQLMDELSPIPSLLLSLWLNESLGETIGMKICVTCIFIRIKIMTSLFDVKHLAQALVLKKRQIAT